MRDFLARRVPLTDDQTPREDVVNSVTHGVGAALASAAAVILVARAATHGDAWRVVSLAVYGASMITLYLASTLYHAFRDPALKRFFRLADHVSIYLLIAGTYTPVTLIHMRGPWGWTIFGLIWAMALGGIASKLFLIGRFEVVSVLFYVAMGWLAIIAVRPVLEMLPPGLIFWLAAGGAFYTLGLVFYAWRRVPYHHAIWHLFVLGGSTCHFLGLLFYGTRA